jgi:hypothetical protein
MGLVYLDMILSIISVRTKQFRCGDSLLLSIEHFGNY